ncbi:MAG: hypothetical protein HC866_03270 [Leptolyngbyaceae cyanobacterium RU_5_1]|nr:hypothetical protein [Leptolyngbyaceae cyanobacterium RU_5_1]
MNLKHLPGSLIATAPNRQTLFADGEVVTTEVMGGSAEFWIVAIALILLVMNCQRVRLQFPSLSIVRRLPIKHDRTDAERALRARDEEAKKVGSRNNR